MSDEQKRGPDTPTPDQLRAAATELRFVVEHMRRSQKRAVALTLVRAWLLHLADGLAADAEDRGK